jgi:hypothetical protein
MNKRISLCYGFVKSICHADSPYWCLQLIQVKIVAFSIKNSFYTTRDFMTTYWYRPTFIAMYI